MKKSRIFFLLLFVVLSFSEPVFGSDRVNMIVLLDNSTSVLPYYDAIQKNLIGKIIKEHLLPGDSFSLITFSDTADVEISREIRSEKDIEDLLEYSAIIQPMGEHTDLVLALRFLYKYTLDLPLNTRKKIIILTDGIHDPPESSPFYFVEKAKVEEEIKKAADDIHREGWDVSIVQVEEDQQNTTADTVSGSEADGNGGHDVLDTVSDSLKTTPNKIEQGNKDIAGAAVGVPLVSIPSHLGNTSGTLKIPITIKNRSNEEIFFSLSSLLFEDNNILSDPVSVKIPADSQLVINAAVGLPDGFEPGEQGIKVTPLLVGGLRISPSSFILNFNYEQRDGFFHGIWSLFDWKVLVIIISIILAVIIILLLRKATFSRVRSAGVKQTDENKSGDAFLAPEKPIGVEEKHAFKKNRPIHMIVYGQNSKSGILNVKWLGLNIKRSVGSANSATFKIFFVNVPALIAKIECTGDDFIFYPVEESMFPEINEPLAACLNMPIKVVNKDGKVFYIEFRQWVSELEKLNRILSMTKESGSPDLDY